LSWVIGIGNSSLLEGKDWLFFVVLEEKEDELVELTLHSFVGDIWQPIPRRELLSSGIRSSCLVLASALLQKSMSFLVWLTWGQIAFTSYELIITMKRMSTESTSRE
jgi:hypothetical protein